VLVNLYLFFSEKVHRICTEVTKMLHRICKSHSPHLQFFGSESLHQPSLYIYIYREQGGMCGVQKQGVDGGKRKYDPRVGDYIYVV